MTWRVLIAVTFAAAACSKSRREPVEPVVGVPEAKTSAPNTETTAPAASAVPDCLAAPADAEKRRPGAEPAESFDIDGNGASDPLFKDCYSGNCNYLLYWQTSGCARFLGEITVSVLDRPRCATPPTDGKPCRLSALRFMIHGDQQEYFYEFTETEYVEAGTGRYIPPRKKSR